MNNHDRFVAALTEAYQNLFQTDPEYAYASKRTTPQALAEKMATGLKTRDANKDGAGIKRACKALKIKHTYTAIEEFLK